MVRAEGREQWQEADARERGSGPGASSLLAAVFSRLSPGPRLAFLFGPPPDSVIGPPVVSSALTSASNSRVSRVTSLPGVRARRPLPLREESHLRWMKVTWQSEQGVPPRNRGLVNSNLGGSRRRQSSPSWLSLPR